jgi:hypothetical protein
VPVILTQHYSPADRIYEDVEYSLYHYPRQYFGRVNPYDRFIYYRPLGKSAPRPDSKAYFGHGVLGQWWPDPQRADHRYVPIIQAGPFPRLVPMYDMRGEYYETETSAAPPFQSAVRDITETAYWKILAAADVKAAGVSLLPNTELIAAQSYATLTAAPLDDLREISNIPPGAGYKPKGDNRVNVFESAALQERARADHQRVLQLIQRQVLRHGGTTWYNNNIDLFARIGEARMLIEAKSLVDLRAAVDRMRYGIGQLADYDYRYRAKLESPQKVLAFGTPPDSQTAWISSVLEDQKIALIANSNERLVPLNDTAKTLPLFEV